jgi:hypothetical protein
MSRSFVVAFVVLTLVAPARGDRIAPIASPVERALRAPIVVVGKVTAIEKEAIETPLYPGGNKVAHKIAVVKVETNLLGAENTTHLKVGFVPAGAGGRRGPDNPTLKEGQEWLFFVTKHHGGAFYAIPYMTPPVDSTAATFKADVEAVKKVLAVVADPMKALKAEKAEDRFAAALALVLKYRTPPEGTLESTQVAIPAEESKLILKALAEGEWKPEPTGTRFNGLAAFYSLGLTDKDAWAPPMVKAGEDYTAQTRAAFVKWLSGPGKDYVIKKIAPKQK